MSGQLAAPGDRGVQPGAPGSGGLWTGPGLTGVRMGLGRGEQVAPTGLGLGPDRPERGSSRLELPGTGEGTVEGVGRGTKVPTWWVALGRALPTTDARGD